MKNVARFLVGLSTIIGGLVIYLFVYIVGAKTIDQIPDGVGEVFQWIISAFIALFFIAMVAVFSWEIGKKVIK